jgi:hypothetical protein
VQILVKVSIGGTPDKPVIMFQYHPTRSGDVAIQLLMDTIKKYNEI